ncbi:MAG: CheR family methyltransferase [Myxococcota bacterium]
MRDAECVEFLQWALPQLRLRWAGFRRVRRQVCKRIARRLRALDLRDVRAYREHLERHSEEWETLDALCRISISRFRRDRAVFDALGGRVLPGLIELARGRQDRELRCWGAGGAAGEEAYTLKLLWEIRLRPSAPDLDLRVTATDVDENLLQRARVAEFERSSLKELPAEWLSIGFEPAEGGYRLLPRFREGIEFLAQDIRRDAPDGPFHLVLCRNLAFTYFDASLQRAVLRRIAGRLVPGGALVVGVHESLPDAAWEFSPWEERSGIHRRRGRAEAGGH